MQEKVDRITAVNQAISDHSWKERSQYNRTIFLEGRVVGTNTLEVNYSTLINLYNHPSYRPANRNEEISARELIVKRAVDQARQAITKLYLPEIKERTEGNLNESVGFKVHPASEKWHCEPVRASYNDSVVQFRYKVFFHF
jgi:hypothetical protein